MNGEELKLSCQQRHYRENVPYSVITPASNRLPRVRLPALQAPRAEKVVLTAPQRYNESQGKDSRR